MSDNGPESLDSKVVKWLRKQGYSLEMRIAQVFRQAGFEVSHFESYLDPESNDLREIDIVASLRRPAGEVDVSVTFFIECKFLPKPWVVFTSSRRFDPFSYFSRILRENYNVREWTTQDSLQGRLLARILWSLGREDVPKFTLFAMPQTAGYAMTEALRKDSSAKDNAFIATMQVGKCVEAHDIEVESVFERTIEECEERLYGSGAGIGEFSLWCSIAFPIIAVNGQLFECCLGPDNELAVSETDESLVLVSNKDRGEISKARLNTSAVRVVTESRVAPFAAEAYQAANALLSEELAIRELWEYERSRILGKTGEDVIPF